MAFGPSTMPAAPLPLTSSSRTAVPGGMEKGASLGGVSVMVDAVPLLESLLLSARVARGATAVVAADRRRRRHDERADVLPAITDQVVRPVGCGVGRRRSTPGKRDGRMRIGNSGDIAEPPE